MDVQHLVLLGGQLFLCWTLNRHWVARSMSSVVAARFWEDSSMTWVEIHNAIQCLKSLNAPGRHMSVLDRNRDTLCSKRADGES